jgi:hypothetical protein
MYKQLDFTAKKDGYYWTFGLDQDWQKTRYKHLVAAQGYHVNVEVPSTHPKRSWLLELMRFEWIEDAWNGPYDLSKTTFEPHPTYDTRFGKTTGWRLYAGQTRTGHLSLRTKNGKRYNWWIPEADIKASIL